MILKICPYCQAENPENAVFCKKCGALFRGNPEIKDTVLEKNKRKNIAIICVCALFFIAALFVIASDSSDEPKTSPAVTNSTMAITTTLPATTMPTTTVPTTITPTTTQVNATTQTPTSTAPIESNSAEICARYNELVGALKAKNTSLTVAKTEKIALEITSFSLPVSTSAINTFMARLIPETDETYNFTNGVAAEDKNITLSGLIPPGVKAAPTVSEENLLSAQEDSQGNITLKFKADSSSYTNGQTIFPEHVGSATDVLDFATFVLGPVNIIKAEIEYPATEIKAEVNKGELTKLEIYQPVNVTSTGGVGSLTADVGMKLQATTTYEIKY